MLPALEGEGCGLPGSQAHQGSERSTQRAVMPPATPGLQLAPVQRQPKSLVSTLTSHLTPWLCSHLPARRFHWEVKSETPQISVPESKLIAFPHHPDPPSCLHPVCQIHSGFQSVDRCREGRMCEHLGAGRGRMCKHLLKCHATLVCIRVFFPHQIPNENGMSAELQNQVPVSCSAFISWHSLPMPVPYTS